MTSAVTTALNAGTSSSNEAGTSAAGNATEGCAGNQSGGTVGHSVQKNSRRREYKAVYLTGSIVSTFVVLWIPFEVARSIQATGYTSTAVQNLLEVGSGVGMLHCSANWILYAAVSKSYRRAYRDMYRKLRGVQAGGD